MKRGTILRREELVGIVPIEISTAAPTPTKKARIVPREWLEAKEEAKTLLATAHFEASTLITQAKENASLVLASERSEMRKAEEARLAASFSALFVREEKLRAGELERVLEMGALLAERIVRSAVAVDPTRMRALAIEIAKEARGTRVLRFEVHPDDLGALSALFDELAMPKEAISFEPNLELARGDVLLHTDLGIIDGRLRTQIERLRRALLE